MHDNVECGDILETSKRLLKTKNGFTLIELIVSLAILMLILSFVAGFYIFNLKAFQNSDRISQVQFDVRMAGDFITSELRNVDTISISNTTLPYLDLSLIRAKYPKVTGLTFTVENQSGNYFVNYTIIGLYTDARGIEKQYQLSSKVLLNNVTSCDFLDTNPKPSIIYYHQATA